MQIRGIQLLVIRFQKFLKGKRVDRDSGHITTGIAKFRFQNPSQVTSCYNKMSLELSGKLPNPIINICGFLNFVNNDDRIR